MLEQEQRSNYAKSPYSHLLNLGEAKTEIEQGKPRYF